MSQTIDFCRFFSHLEAHVTLTCEEETWVFVTTSGCSLRVIWGSNDFKAKCDPDIQDKVMAGKTDLSRFSQLFSCKRFGSWYAPDVIFLHTFTSKDLDLCGWVIVSGIDTWAYQIEHLYTFGCWNNPHWQLGFYIKSDL